jgi:hypothetical protein
MFREISPLLLEVRDFFLAGELRDVVWIESIPARKVFAVEDCAKTVRRIGFRGVQCGRWSQQIDGGEDYESVSYRSVH